MAFRIQVNGEWREIERPMNVAELLALLSFEPRRVAVERNKQLVPRARHAETLLAANDVLEIVTLVGGG